MFADSSLIICLAILVLSVSALLMFGKILNYFSGNLKTQSTGKSEPTRTASEFDSAQHDFLMRR